MVNLPCNNPGKKTLTCCLQDGPIALAKSSHILMAVCAIFVLLSTNLAPKACGRSPKFDLINLHSDKMLLIFVNASFLTFQFLSDNSVIKDSVI